MGNQAIESQAESIFATAQKLLIEYLVKNGKVLCATITEDCAKDQQRLFADAGYKTFYVQSQPNACTFYLDKS